MQKSLSVPFATALLSNVATAVNVHETEHMLTSTQDFSFAQVNAFAETGIAEHVCQNLLDPNRCET